MSDVRRSMCVSAGMAVLHNMPLSCTAEAAMAAAVLLPHVSDYAHLLLRPGVLVALADAVLLEAACPDPETAGEQQTRQSFKHPYNIWPLHEKYHADVMTQNSSKISRHENFESYWKEKRF